MVSAIISRVVILVFGTLYPAYASYKAVRTKNVKEYVKWMMYWIVFALFCCVETFSDVFLSWLPFYYELKIVFVIWMLSPLTQGSSFIFKKFVHPQLARREKDIDEMITQASKQSYTTLLSLGTKGVNYASQVVMKTAIMGQSKLVDHLRRSYSTSDLTDDGQSLIQRHEAVSEEEGEDELDNRLKEDNAELEKRTTSSSKVKLSRSKSSASSYSLSSVKEEEDCEGEEEEKVITETFTIPITSRKPLSAKEEFFRAQRLARCQSLPPPLTDKPSTPPLTTTLQTPERKRQSFAYNRADKLTDEGNNEKSKKSEQSVAPTILEKRNLFTKSHSQDNVLIQRSKPQIMAGINFQTRKRLLLQRAQSEEPMDRFVNVQRRNTRGTLKVEQSTCDVKKENEGVVMIEKGNIVKEKDVVDVLSRDDKKNVTAATKKSVVSSARKEKENPTEKTFAKKDHSESKIEPEEEEDLLIFTKDETAQSGLTIDEYSMADPFSPMVLQEGKDLTDVIIIDAVDLIQTQGDQISTEPMIIEIDDNKEREELQSEYDEFVHKHSSEVMESDSMLMIDDAAMENQERNFSDLKKALSDNTKMTDLVRRQNLDQSGNTLTKGFEFSESLNTKPFQFKGSKFTDIDEECRSWSTPTSPVMQPKNPGKTYHMDPRLGSWRMELISRRLYASVPDTRLNQFRLSQTHSVSQDHLRNLSGPPGAQAAPTQWTDRHLFRSLSLDSSREPQPYYSPHPMAFAPSTMFRPRAKSLTSMEREAFNARGFRKMSQDKPSSLDYQPKKE